MAILHALDLKWGLARTGTIELPLALSDLVNQGIELGLACDQVQNKTKTKHAAGSYQNASCSLTYRVGAVGFLTAGLIDRTEYYVHALTLALAPFIHPDQQFFPY